MSGIKYFIYQTRLQNQPKFFGRVILKGIYDQAALIQRMLNMGSSLTKPDIIAVLQLLSMAIAKVCGEGCKVNLDGLIQITPVLSRRGWFGTDLRLVNTGNPSEFVPVTKFHKLANQELVFRLPEVTFGQGYFELANSLGTASVRIGRSATFLLAQG